MAIAKILEPQMTMKGGRNCVTECTSVSLVYIYIYIRLISVVRHSQPVGFGSHCLNFWDSSCSAESWPQMKAANHDEAQCDRRDCCHSRRKVLARRGDSEVLQLWRRKAWHLKLRKWIEEESCWFRSFRLVCLVTIFLPSNFFQTQPARVGVKKKGPDPCKESGVLGRWHLAMVERKDPCPILRSKLLGVRGWNAVDTLRGVGPGFLQQIRWVVGVESNSLKNPWSVLTTTRNVVFLT